MSVEKGNAPASGAVSRASRLTVARENVHELLKFAKTRGMNPE